ncbi:MAG: ActS/PrrB/RegB family redox-sensitive histidine kinase [Aestuariivirgaceae bacterium]|nr:ActS/PrrB/RegB family redox-sensitive histidine kinase [Aestuariivirgaceae bacterium]
MAELVLGGAPGLRLQTLIRLRWVAVIGQMGAVLAVRFGLGFELPLAFCLVAIALSAWLNIFLSWRWSPTYRLSDRAAAFLLGYDILQLASLLGLTGGLQNPFAFLFLVPVTISATSLPRQATLALAALSLGLASLLAVFHLPLPWSPPGTLVVPALYVAGLWAALLSGTVFSALYAGRIALEARQMQDALVATEMVLAREQQLSALDGLAAAAAHELGTPLATIALVAKELKRELPNARDFSEDLDLLTSQAMRCREILSRLSNREAQSDTMFQRLKLTVMIEEIVAPLRGAGIIIAVNQPDGPQAPEPVFARNPAVAYGLANLLENAVDFAHARVEVEARWSATSVSLAISDDGPGFSEEVYARLGDPFVTTRKGYEVPEPGDGHQGMGLGFFIAKTLLERSGAQVSLANRRAPSHGAVVKVAWPRDVISAP